MRKRNHAGFIQSGLLTCKHANKKKDNPGFRDIQCETSDDEERVIMNNGLSDLSGVRS